MRKFIARLLVFFLLVSAIIELVNIAYIKMDKADKDDTMKFASVPEHIQICNFGSSHGAYGFNYEDYNKEYTCFNFALPSQTLSYDYRLLTYYQDHIGRGTVVFIPISYFSFFGKGETFEPQFQAKNKRYYTFLPKGLIKDYDIVYDFGMKCIPSLLANPNDVVKALLGRTSNFHEMRWRTKAEDVNLAEDAEQACIRHLKTGRIDDSGKRIVNDEEVKALYDMIELCRGKGAIPVLVTIPLLNEYIEDVKKDESFYEDFNSLVYKITTKTGVEYYDYAVDERFSHNYDWFMDSDHLNKAGAQAFMDILMKEIVFPKGYY